jgi:flagellar basal body rod protein FlgG
LDIQPKFFFKNCYLKFEEFSPPKKKTKIYPTENEKKKKNSKKIRNFLKEKSNVNWKNKITILFFQERLYGENDKNC